MENLTKALNFIREKTDFIPEVALTLGSGLGGFADKIKVECAVEYRDIPGFPISTVKGHAGRFLFGTVCGTKVAAMQGRVHYYEGYSMRDVVMPARLLGLLGAKVLFLTNAAGGVNLSFRAGTLMAITDHILLAPNPLIGENIAELGTRFPDMTGAYDPELVQILKDSAKAVNVELREGVYTQLTGPSFETPAEVRMVRALGGDAVGMSTACEAVAARHMGMRVCGVSCITNMGAGVTGQPLTHEEVSETAGRVSRDFEALVTESIARIGRSLRDHA